MSRYIDADKLIEHFKAELEKIPLDPDRFPTCYGLRLGYAGVFDYIYSQPLVDVKADAVKRTIDAVRSKAVRNAYSCMISGELRETYTIKGIALTEIEESLLS